MDLQQFHDNLLSHIPEQVTVTHRPPPEIYVDLIQATKDPGEFSTSFIVLQRNFVKQCPEKLKDLLRLVKHWYKEVSCSSLLGLVYLFRKSVHNLY